MDREAAAGRLAELKREYTVGENRLRELTQQQAVLRETLLRISGAIQVLEELMAAGDDSPAGGPEHDGSPGDMLTVP